jgi:hypothetical protein
MFVRGKEASWDVVIGWRFCPHWYMSIEYHIVKWQCRAALSRFPHSKVMMLFRCVPQA